MAAFSIMENFGTDLEMEENGVETQIGENTFITVAREGNKKYNAMLADKYEESQFVLKQKNAASELRAEAIMAFVMARTILVGWRGNITLEKGGEPQPYSADNAEKLLKVKDFRTMVQALSRNAAKYRKEALEETAKN